VETLDQITRTLALSMGAAWGSGINLYATLLVLGYLSITGGVVLPPELQILANPLVIGAAGLMYCVEFFADKMPGVDTGWDAIHTFIRVPAGALLAAGAVGDIGPAAELAAAIAGGGLAAATHATKAGSRVLINSSPEPFSNWGASIGEDIAVIVGVWASLQHPELFIVFMVLFVILLIWLLPKLWCGIKQVFRFLANLVSGKKEPVTQIKSLE
jgi:hypothetical protein